MKTVLSTIIALCCLNLQAAQFSVGPSLISTNLAYAVAPPGSTVQFVQAYGFNSLPGLDFLIYDGTASLTISNALAASVGSNILCTITAGAIVPGDSVVICDVSADTYQRGWVHTTNSNAGGFVLTNLYVIGAPGALSTQTLVAGDKVYKLTSKGTRKVANDTTLTLGGSGGLVWKAPSTMPSVFEAVNVTSTLLTNVWVIISGEN